MSQVKLAAKSMIANFNLPEGSTVADLREEAEIGPEVEIRIYGEKVADDFVIPETDTPITVIGTISVKGNR